MLETERPRPALRVSCAAGERVLATRVGPADVLRDETDGDVRSRPTAGRPTA